MPSTELIQMQDFDKRWDYNHPETTEKFSVNCSQKRTWLPILPMLPNCKRRLRVPWGYKGNI